MLEVTLDLVRESAVDDVRVTDIASRAGMTTGHVMYHFGTRREILAATLAYSEEDWTQSLRQALDEVQGSPARLALWIRAFLPTGRSDPNWKLWMHFWLAEPADSPELATTGESESPWRLILLQILDSGRVEESFRLTDAPHFATWFHKLALGVALSVLLGWMSAEEGQDMVLERAASELRCPDLAPSAGSKGPS